MPDVGTDADFERIESETRVAGVFFDTNVIREARKQSRANPVS
jgi:hypothetical protein